MRAKVFTSSEWYSGPWGWGWGYIFNSLAALAKRIHSRKPKSAETRLPRLFSVRPTEKLITCGVLVIHLGRGHADYVRCLTNLGSLVTG